MAVVKRENCLVRRSLPADLRETIGFFRGSGCGAFSGAGLGGDGSRAAFENVYDLAQLLGELIGEQRVEPVGEAAVVGGHPVCV